MEKWGTIKHLIQLHKKERWTDQMDALLHNFDLPMERVEELTKSDNLYVSYTAEWHKGIMEQYDVRRDYNNVVSIKLVIPSYCQAKCEFCFMKSYERMEHDYDLFLMRYLDSLGDVVNALYGKHPISLDITGNEPTFNPDLLRKVLRGLKQSRWLEKLNRVVMTTNGYNLDDVIEDLMGVVDYVNISTHHYDINERRKVFGTWRIPEDVQLRKMVLHLLTVGVRTSTVAVIYRPMDGFQKFVEEYIRWADVMGFESVRFRGDCSTGEFAPVFNQYIADVKASGKYTVIQDEHTNDSHWCRLVDEEGHFFFMLQGVQSTYECSRGIEYIISDDGLPYLDYYKQHPFRKNDLPVGYIFDRKK